MTKDQVSALMGAVEDLEIKYFMVVDDITTRLYNKDNAILKADDSNEMFVGIRANDIGGSHKSFATNLQVVAIDYTDVHEFIIGADYQTTIDFMNKIGVELSDAEMEMILNLDKRNYNLIPPTGDYNRFVPLTEEQYEKLSPEQKEEYDAKKAEEEEKEKNYIGQNVAARIFL